MVEHVRLGEPDTVDAEPPFVDHDRLTRQADRALHDPPAQRGRAKHHDVRQLHS